MFAPVLKSVSVLPHTEKGSYAQMPYEGITEEEYHKRINAFPKVDFSHFSGSDGILVKYCTNDTCDLINTSKNVNPLNISIDS